MPDPQRVSSNGAIPAQHRRSPSPQGTSGAGVHQRHRIEQRRPEHDRAVPQQVGRGDAVDQLSSRLVPPSLWAVVEPLIPPVKVRHQGGGRGRVGNRTVFTAIVFVLASGCAWRHLPPSFGVTVPTAHRRYQEWTEAGLWRRLRRAAQDGLLDPAQAAWIAGVLDAAELRSAKAGV
jgi:transposase